MSFRYFKSEGSTILVNTNNIVLVQSEENETKLYMQAGHDTFYIPIEWTGKEEALMDYLNKGTLCI